MNKGNLQIIAKEEVRYPIADDESICDAVLAAFSEINIDYCKQDTVLDDWIEIDGIESMRWESNESLMVTTVVWEHPVHITKSEVTIYPRLPDE